MALKGVLAKDPVTQVYLSQRWKALRAIRSWLQEGAERPLKEAAAEHRVSIRTIRKILSRDDKLLTELFGALTVEARTLAARALGRLSEEVENTDLHPREIVRIGEFASRFAGGQFDAKALMGPVIIGQINLPPDAQEETRRIKAVELATESLKGHLDE